MNINSLCVPGIFFLTFGNEETWPGITGAGERMPVFSDCLVVRGALPFLLTAKSEILQETPRHWAPLWHGTAAVTLRVLGSAAGGGFLSPPGELQVS